MGAVRSRTNHTGLHINGVDLGGATLVHENGTPAQIGDDATALVFQWEHQSLPNGTLTADGVLIPDALEHVGP